MRDCGRSLMKVRNNAGPSTFPCGMPDFGDCHDDLNPLLYEEAELCDGEVIGKKPTLVLKVQRM